MSSPLQTFRANSSSSTAPEHSKQEHTVVRNGKGDLTDDMVESDLLHYLHFEDNNSFFPPSQLGKELDTLGAKDQTENRYGHAWIKCMDNL